MESYSVIDAVSGEELNRLDSAVLGELALDESDGRIIHKCQANNSVFETYRFFTRQERLYGFSAGAIAAALRQAAREIIEQALEDAADLAKEIK